MRPIFFAIKRVMGMLAINKGALLPYEEQKGVSQSNILFLSNKSKPTP